MNTLHLSYAVEVARCGSITQAAENLYMAQPNLSKAIKELEENVGFAIFARTSRGVVPTARGRDFLVCARTILAQEQKMKLLSSMHDDQLQRISLVLPTSGYITNVFSRFLDTLDTNKPMEINIRELPTRQAISAVADGLFSLAAIRVTQEEAQAIPDYLKSRDLEYQLIWQYDGLLLLPYRHPLAEAKRITRADLLPYPMIAESEEPAFRPMREPLQPIAGRLTAEGRGQRLELLSHLTHAYTWSSPETAQTLRRYELVQRACAEGAPHFSDLLIYQTGYSFTAMSQRFLSLVKETCQQLSGIRYT